MADAAQRARRHGQAFLELELVEDRHGAGLEYVLEDRRIDLRAMFGGHPRQEAPVPFGDDRRLADLARVVRDGQRVAAAGGDGVERILIRVAADAVERNAELAEAL